MQKKGIFNVYKHKQKRAKLRHNQTEPEKKLWNGLRSKQLGVKFRRQHGIANYIVDFYCPECSLVIELDGDSHYNDQATKKDQIRDAYLNSIGLKVIRFTNDQVMKNYQGVIESLQNSLPRQH